MELNQRRQSEFKLRTFSTPENSCHFHSILESYINQLQNGAKMVSN